MLGFLFRSSAPRLLGAGTLKAFMAAFNHLLSQHPNAATRLSAHAGRRLRIGVDADKLPSLLPRPELWATISADGMLQSAEAGEADVELLLKPSLAAGQALASQGVGGLSSHLRVEGDVLLAGLLGELIQELRWDFEDDLARVVGDPAAQRVGDAMRSGSEKAGHLFSRAREQAASVAREATSGEGAGTVARQAFSSAKKSLGQLDQRLADLEKKIKDRK